MGNGTEVVQEKKIEEVGVSEERVEEKAVLGSDGLNEADAEEVFEEAMEENHEQLLEEHDGLNTVSGDRDGCGKGGDVRVIDDDEERVEGIHNGGDEVENFEEAIGVPDRVEIGGDLEAVETIVEEKGDGAAIDEGGTKTEDLINEVNGQRNGGEEDVKVISEIVVDGEGESINPGIEVDDGTCVGVDNEKSENDEVEKLANKAVSLNSHQESEPSKEILTEGNKDSDSDVITLRAEDGTASVENSSAAEDYDGNAAKVSHGLSLPLDGEKGVDQDEKLVDAEVHESNTNEVTHITVATHSIGGDDSVTPENSHLHTEQNDSSNVVVEDTSARQPSANNVETHEPVKTLGNGQKSTEDKEVTLEVVSPSFSEKTTIEKTEVITVTELRTENHRASQPEQVRDVHVVSDNGTSNEAKKKEEKTHELPRENNQRAQGLASLPAKPTSSLPAKSTAQSPAIPTTSLPAKPTASLPAKPTASLPAKPSSSLPAKPTSSLPAKPTASLPAKSTTPASPSLEKSTNSASSPARPAGLGRGAPLLEPASRVMQQPRVNGTVSHSQNSQVEEPANGDSEEYDETREKLQMIRVKFLRLAHRLGQTPHNVVVAQVLYRLGLAEQLRGRNGGRVGAFSFDHASAKAEQLEASGQEPLDFSCTIMVLGKTGVGKSATINSIFDEVKFGTDAFQMGTKKVQDVVGTVQGIKVRVIDTPGLLPSWSDQRQNEKILQSVKRFISKTPPDIVLYLDRLDMQSRDFSDMPLLRTITEIFGPSIWCNAIVVLTHAASAPPDGPNGTASSYDMFVTQRSHVVQQAIRQAAADMRLMNPVSLVENHSACRTNRAGQRVLPNGQVWKPHLLLLSFASKILAEANALLKLQDSPPGKPFAARSRAPPLPYLLSSLLQSRPQLKLPEEQFGNDVDLDDDLDDSSDSDGEAEYDELPPFTPLTKAQVSKLSKTQKKAYFDEIEYREKLFMKKQLKEERSRRKMMKKMAAEMPDLPREYTANPEEENQPSVPMVPMPDLALPASFDSDNPTHRYRCLDSSNKWLVRPVLETHGWDHDVGYEGINVDRLFVVKNKIPLSLSGQVTKDKKDANLQLEVASSIKHGEGKATSIGLDMQTVGKDLAYTLRSETRFSNFRRNKATAGISVTLLGDALSGGIKVEDKLIASKRFQVVMAGGAMAGRGEVAYGGSLEAQLRDKDHPYGRSLSSLGLSVMDWHGDLAIGCNVQSQFPVGRNTNVVARANLNNRGSGQVSIRLSSSEQLQIALIALIPLIKRLLAYPQQLQYGQ